MRQETLTGSQRHNIVLSSVLLKQRESTLLTTNPTEMSALRQDVLLNHPSQSTISTQVAKNLMLSTVPIWDTTRMTSALRSASYQLRRLRAPVSHTAEARLKCKVFRPSLKIKNIMTHAGSIIATLWHRELLILEILAEVNARIPWKMKTLRIQRMPYYFTTTAIPPSVPSTAPIPISQRYQLTRNVITDAKNSLQKPEFGVKTNTGSTWTSAIDTTATKSTNAPTLASLTAQNTVVTIIEIAASKPVLAQLKSQLRNLENNNVSRIWTPRPDMTWKQKII
jgi:hypothetical protein